MFRPTSCRSDAVMRTAIGVALVVLSACAAPAVAAPPPRANGPLTFVGLLRTDDPSTPFKWRRFTVDPSGRSLRSEPVHARVMNLVASPDGRRIAYQYDNTVYVARRDGGRARRVATHATDPSWAPGGERLVYAQVALDLPTQQVDGGLIVARVDGRGKHRLTRGSDRLPAWSPDGSTIAFVRDRSEHGCDGASSLYVTRSRGRARRQFAPGYSCGSVGRPDWSPHGDRLVVTLGRALSEVLGDEERDHSTDARAEARVGINTLRADGTHRRRLTTRNGDSPVWSPHGRQIAYHAHLSTCTGDQAPGDAVCAITPRGSARTIVAMPTAFSGALGLTWLPKSQPRT